MADSQTFVIVGASLAGAKAAEALRAEGFDGRIVLVGEEPVRPYERPPLSKGYLRGEVGFDDAAVHAEGFYEDESIELLTSTTVTAIDPTSKVVTLDPGGSWLTTKFCCRPVPCPVRCRFPGRTLPTFTICGVSKAATPCAAPRASGAGRGRWRLDRFRGGRLGPPTGEGRGNDRGGPRPARACPRHPSGYDFQDLHTDHGVELHLGVGVEAFRGTDSAEEVVLADGTAVNGDLFVVGVGVIPRTELAEGAGLELNNGVIVDEFLATSVPGIWAAGDVANAYHPVFGARIRLEHWSAALNQGPVAAKNMMGQKVAYSKIPYFFSDQYDLGMEYSGYAVDWDTLVFRGDREKREFIAFWLAQGRVVAGMNVNVWDVADQIASLVASKRVVDVDKLEDPDIDLVTLAGDR